MLQAILSFSVEPALSRQRVIKLERSIKSAHLVLAALLLSASVAAQPLPQQQVWSPQAAASYLDGRLQWWTTWATSQRDHETFCISCHTVLPYALGRPALRHAVHETGPSANEVTLLANLTKRVRLWKEVAPFYPDATRGPGKTLESRGTEAILNALVLTSNHAPAADVSLALENMLAEQFREGEAAGAWPWLQFHNAPWEGDSQFYGATLAALALGRAPSDYREKPAVQQAITRLSAYLKSTRTSQTLMDQMNLVWASTLLPGLLNASEKKAILNEVLATQLPDGGFSLSRLVGAWKRKDNTPLDARSDGYATGLIAMVMQQMVLQQPGIPSSKEPISRSLAWLRANQDPAEGRWPAWSLNKQRELNSDAGRFMSDAATAFAVMALETAK